MGESPRIEPPYNFRTVRAVPLLAHEPQEPAVRVVVSGDRKNTRTVEQPTVLTLGRRTQQPAFPPPIL